MLRSICILYISCFTTTLNKDQREALTSFREYVQSQHDSSFILFLERSDRVYDYILQIKSDQFIQEATPGYAQEDTDRMIKMIMRTYSCKLTTAQYILNNVFPPHTI